MDNVSGANRLLQWKMRHIDAIFDDVTFLIMECYTYLKYHVNLWLSGVPDYFGRNKISSGGDLSH